MTERDCKHGRLARSCEICAMEEEIDDLKYELGVAREAQQCECSSDDACRFARERDALKEDIEKLHSVMMAAAVEITSHWDAHCDAEGFGPVNLVRRLEKGYPAQYGYDSQTLIRVEAQRDALVAELAAKPEPGIDRIQELERTVEFLRHQYKLQGAVRSFAETHPANPAATCKCEHWQSCADCHPTTHAKEKTE